ncbi:FAD-binding protein [Nocardiopsis gilva YIM 90087]|uniref:FAD-binding protein n=1 Tax=Nocardiopsis gilva YIM 90087 TaxID=1235441 RepID=A0A223S7W8_9ACTN|nr:D-arabinono-1,4-lactone oxidase [Nocardiopsis gilva]ASU84203.1 FAD-binding protein [Nocardiopsis gilva YIM 90087]
MDRRRTNWAGNITFRAARMHFPASIEQLRHLIARSTRVRALGSAHSFSDIADGPGDLVCLDDLPATIEVDGERSTVTVGAGVRYAELGRLLHEKGYALHNLGSLPHISVVGSCATATHGSGDANGGLATAVREMEMVTAEGDLVVLRSDDPDDRFNGAVVGLGALGVVVRMTLDIGPTFDMRQHVYEGLPAEALDDHLTEITSSGYSVSLFTTWRGPLIDQVWVKRKVDGHGTEPTGATGTTAPDPAPPGPDRFGARLADAPRHPIVELSAVNCTEQLGVRGPWFARLPHFRPDVTPSSGEELQAEYLVPRRHAVAAFRALDAIRARIAPVVQVSEIRTVAADELWMSPAYRRDAVAFHFTWIADAEAVLPVMALVEERLAPFEARPHWGKLFTTPPRVLRPLYERLPDFQRLVHDYDPTGKFGNDFLGRNLLGGA